MNITSNQLYILLFGALCLFFLTAASQPPLRAVNNNLTGEFNYATTLAEANQSWLNASLTTNTQETALDRKHASMPDPACDPVVVLAVSGNNICGGTTVTFTATVTNGGTNPKFSWKKNGVSAGAIDGSEYTTSNLHNGDRVVCEYSCKTVCGTDTTVTSNTVTMHITHDVEPAVTVTNYDTLICEGELAVFNAEASYGDWTPTFQWRVNDSIVGTNSPTYNTSTITNGAKVECFLTVTSPACPGVTKTAHSQLNIYVYPLVHPAIVIKPSKTDICRGEEVTFNATANGGSYPAFTWMINGVQSGPNAPSLASSTLNDGDKITCIVTIEQDSRCHASTTSAGSNEVVVHVRDFVEPSVSISSPLLDVCQGETITFTAAPKNAGGLTLYQWQVNGNGKGPNSPVFTYDGFSDGDKVSCLLTTNIQGCPFSRTAASDTEVVTIRATPVITFSPPEISIMAGDPFQLQAIVSGDLTSFLWQPAGILVDPQTLTPTIKPLEHDTTLHLSVVDENGCKAANEILIKVLHKLYMPSAFTPNRDGKNDVFRVPPGASLDLNEFIIFNRWGNVVFRTTNSAKGWDGTFNGSLSEPGIYVYLIKGSVLGQKINIKGTVTLIR